MPQIMIWCFLECVKQLLLQRKKCHYMAGQEERHIELGVVMHTCNPSYLGVRGRRIKS
jgi:hypothetical protein